MLCKSCVGAARIGVVEVNEKDSADVSSVEKKALLEEVSGT